MWLDDTNYCARRFSTLPISPGTPSRPFIRRCCGFFRPATADLNSHLRLLEPLPYLEFLALQQQATMVITDSGGIQEETTFSGVPCLTVRENAERPITITHGTNQLVGRDLARLRLAAEQIATHSKGRDSTVSNRNRVPLWDGHAAERVAEVIGPYVAYSQSAVK